MLEGQRDRDVCHHDPPRVAGILGLRALDLRPMETTRRRCYGLRCCSVREGDGFAMDHGRRKVEVV